MEPFYDNLTPRLLFMIRRRTKHAEKRKMCNRREDTSSSKMPSLMERSACSRLSLHGMVFSHRSLCKAARKNFLNTNDKQNSYEVIF